MSIDDEKPPEAYEAVRKQNFSDKQFLNLLKWKDDFEERCPEISSYSPDQFATEFHFFSLATKQEASRLAKIGIVIACVSAIIFIASFQADPYTLKWLVYVGSAIGTLIGIGLVFSSFSDSKPDMEMFFEYVRDRALNKVELDKRLGKQAPRRANINPSSAFDVPPQK